jgi:MFS family permease
MAIMGFTTPSTSVMVYFVALAITGIAESFRSVSITPSAQAMLSPQDMGVGTSLINFVNSLASTIAAAVFGVAYNLRTAADPTNVANIQSGCNLVFWVAAIVSVIGLLLVLFVVRPNMEKKAAEAANAQ